MSIAPMLNIAGGIVLGRMGIRALGLGGLGATAEECEQWRRIAAGADYAQHTDEERRQAAENYNTQCRQPSPTAVPPMPDPADYRPAVIPAPECGFDPVCIDCAGQIAQYNAAAMENARNAYGRALCERNNALNIAAGHPENVVDCNARFPIRLLTKPACAAIYAGKKQVAAPTAGGSYLIPNASWGESLPAVEADKAGLVSLGDEQAKSSAAVSNSMQEQSRPAPATDQGPAPGRHSSPEGPDAGNEAATHGDSSPSPSWERVRKQLATVPWWVYLAAGAVVWAAIGGER